MAEPRKPRSEWKDLSQSQKAQLQAIRDDLSRPELAGLDPATLTIELAKSLKHIRSAFTEMRKSKKNKHRKILQIAQFESLISNLKQKPCNSTVALGSAILSSLVGTKHSSFKFFGESLEQLLQAFSDAVKQSGSCPRTFRDLILKLARSAFGPRTKQHMTGPASVDGRLVLALAQTHLSAADRYVVGLRALLVQWHLFDLPAKCRWICDVLRLFQGTQEHFSGKRFGGIGGWKGWSQVPQADFPSVAEYREWLVSEIETQKEISCLLQNWTAANFRQFDEYCQSGLDLRRYIQGIWTEETSNQQISRMLDPLADSEVLEPIEKILQLSIPWIQNATNHSHIETLHSNCAKNNVYAPSLDFLMKKYRTKQDETFQDWTSETLLGKRDIQRTKLELTNSMYFHRGSSLFVAGLNNEQKFAVNQISGLPKSAETLSQLQLHFEMIYESRQFGNEKHFSVDNSLIGSDFSTFVNNIETFDELFRRKMLFYGSQNQLTLYKSENHPSRARDVILLADQLTGNLKLFNPKTRKTIAAATPDQVGYQDMLPLDSHKTSLIISPKLGVLSRCTLENIDGQTQLYSWRLRRVLPNTIAYDSSYNVRIVNAGRLYVYTPLKCSIYNLHDISLVQEVATSIKAPSFGVAVSPTTNLVNEEKWAMVALHHLKESGEHSQIEYRSFSDSLGYNMTTWNYQNYPPIRVSVKENSLSFGYSTEEGDNKTKLYFIKCPLFATD